MDASQCSLLHAAHAFFVYSALQAASVQALHDFDVHVTLLGHPSIHVLICRVQAHSVLCAIQHTCSLSSLTQARRLRMQVESMLVEAQAGIAAGRMPEAALEGMGGTYFLSGAAGSRVAMFKPCDEEPLAPNNPKQWQGRAMGMPGMKPSVRVGEAALREVAAYLLDHGAFAGVPAACLAKCYHPALNYKVRRRVAQWASLQCCPCTPDVLGCIDSGGGARSVACRICKLPAL